MLELLLVLAVAVYLVSKLDAQHFQKANARYRLSSNPRAIARPEPPPPIRLAIEGTQRPQFRNNRFLKGFGVNPNLVQDIRIYARLGALEQFPATLAALLQDLYLKGSAVGSDIMELLFHGRALKEGEAVYFALIEAKPEPRVVAFVDKLRTA